MGYESRLYITAGPHRNEDAEPISLFDGAAFCPNIAEFDLAVVGSRSPLSKLFAESIAVEKERIDAEGWRHSVYEVADGNTMHTDDKYGDPLSPVRLASLVEALIEASHWEPYYRRFSPLLAMLQAFNAQVAAGEWGRNGILVLHYGH